MYGLAVIEVMTMSGHLSNIDEINAFAHQFWLKKLKNHGYFSLQADSWGSQIAFGQPHFLDSLSTRFFHRESVAITFITQLLNWIPYQVEWSPPNLNWNSCIVGCNLNIYGRYFRNFLQIKMTPLQCKYSEIN